MAPQDDPTRRSDADDASVGDEAAHRERLRYLAIRPDDAARLTALKPVFEAVGDAFVDAFYRHLFSFEATAAFLRDPERVERLKQLQREHLRSLFDATWDESFFNRRRRVGLVHAEVGIEPQYFVGAYNQLVQHCAATLRQDVADDNARERFDDLAVLVKAILLDIGVSLEAYFEQSTRRLQRALEIIEKANDELRRFAQLTTHDLKTPLATVANLCDEAIDEFGKAIPGEALRLIQSARDAAFRMSALVDELLSTAVVAAHSDTAGPTDSGLALRQAVERVQPLLREKHIDLSIPRQMPIVRGNAVRLREAFYNLLSNACKFIDTTPGRIQVTAEFVADDVLFRIADNGPGIPADELARIFVPFRRLPIHRGQPGSGLGLYFTRNLIDQQGGRIWAESQPGRGACFCIQLKAARQP